MPNEFPNNPTFLALARTNDEAETYYRDTVERLRAENAAIWDKYFGRKQFVTGGEISHYATHQYLERPE